MTLRLTFLILMLLGVFDGYAAPAGDARKSAGSQSGKSKPDALSYDRDIKPILVEFCFDCHSGESKKGGFALDEFPNTAAMMADLRSWEHVMLNVQNRVMPPEKKPQPSYEQREKIAHWIEKEVFKCDCDNPDPGRVTIRRLNRSEYNNTVRDLLGVSITPADDFPADDSGYGFDNIGDVLSVPPVLLEKYLAAADRVLDAAIGGTSKLDGPTNRIRADAMQKRGVAVKAGETGLSMTAAAELSHSVDIPREGDYIFRVRAYGTPVSNDPPKVALKFNGQVQETFDVTADDAASGNYEFKSKVPAGARTVSLTFVNPSRDIKTGKYRTLVVERLDVVGPLMEQPLPDSYKRVFTRQPVEGKERETAFQILRDFAWKAYRRPVSSAEVERLLSLYDLGRKNKETFEVSMRLSLKAVLVSPHFLFRGELQPSPNDPQESHPIDEFSLASRLSYFLWSSMPDDELSRLAQLGKLRQNLSGQIRRMLNDPKSKELVENFGGQWLQLRNLAMMAPDKKQFPGFDDALRNDMERETIMFFDSIVREDRSVLDFLNADYTFVNERLAKHYGMPNIQGEAFQKVSLKGTGRAGLLTHGSILTLTSNPTRTSPVKRGKWVLENLLGTPPPPPPPDVPELDAEGKALTGTLRQRLEQHRKNPACASCHARMDPIGFGLENFDGVGARREKDGGSPIDPAGNLVSGEEFKGSQDLADILANKKRAEFIHCISEKMLTYALGRGMEFYDKCAVEQVGKNLMARDYKFSTLIIAVVQSTPFQMRRGEGQRVAQSGN